MNSKVSRFLQVLAWVLLAFNVAIEANFFFALRNDPTFVPGTNKMDSAISIGAGWAGVFDVIALSPIGIVILISAIILRRGMTRERLRQIVIVCVAGLLVFPGTISFGMASLMGPNEHALQGQQNARDSKTTMDRIRSQGVPKQFSMIDEYWPGEPDSSWRTGVFNLDEPKIAETCSTVIDYAAKNGATKLQQLPSGPVVELANHDAAVEACVATMNTYPHKKRHKFEVTSQQLLLSGVSNVAPTSPIGFRLTLIKYGYSWEKPNTWGYELFIATNYGQQ